MRNTLLYILLLLSTFSWSQSVLEELQAIEKGFKGNNYSFNITYNYFNDVANSHPDEIVKGFTRVNGNKFHYTLGQMEVISNGELILVADNESDVLMLDSAHQSQSPEQIGPINMSELEAFVQKVKRIETDDMLEYSIPDPANGIQRMILKVNKASKAFVGVELYFYENRPGLNPKTVRNKLIIEFSQVNMKANLSDSHFQLNKYLLGTETGFQRQSKYKNYDFINHLN